MTYNYYSKLCDAVEDAATNAKGFWEIQEWVHLADFLEEEYERYRINQNQDYETWRIHEELLKKNEEYHPLCFIRLKGVLDDYENRGLLKWDISEQDKFHLICELIDALKNKEEI